MATATVGKSKESRVGPTRRLVFESIGKTGMSCPLPFGPDEPVNAGHEPEGLSAATETNLSVPLHRLGFLTSLLVQLAAFNDRLLGPPLSKHDRVNAQLIRAQDERYLLG